MDYSVRSYLDYNATAPLRPQVREALIAAMDVIGNPSSVHQEGRAARAQLEKARMQVASLVGAEAGSVIFTSGATEANMMALTPAMKWDYKAKPAAHLYCSAVEHPSVLSGGRFGAKGVTFIPVDAQGVVDLEALKALLEAHDGAQGVPYVSVMAVNSETGVVQPINEIAALAREYDGYCHIDAVQAAGRIELDIKRIGCTSIALSSHKLGGPKGVGALVMAGEGLEPEPLITGGPQENRTRAGTENITAIIGFGVAAELALQSMQGEEDAAEETGLSAQTAMRDAFEAGLRAFVPHVVIFGEKAARAGNCCQFAIPGLKAETLLIQLDLAGIAVSSGSACSSGKISASHVLTAMGYDEKVAGAAIRVSFGWASKAQHGERLLSEMYKICAKHSKNTDLGIVKRG